MPLMRIDVIKGHDQEFLKKLMQIAYRTQTDAFHTPVGDRYQVLTQHEPFEMQIGDTGLGYKHTKNVVIFNVIHRPKSTKEKQQFYTTLVNRLNQELHIRKEDVIFTMVSNHDDDWSFGDGEMQFINGKL
ncbi:putative tautomerase YrdN [Philodulcilactobacillus myokoensis]|uniref:Tautomerase YrdN n=1 Tax=Philodulcilactobacillus myokoensis TaxID=2929573 RepID=A0A9W6ESH7_9LACO|nr:tautomerase family protein [Philodulcilactobacillus myokoensis]GLB46149.1 putative tautomerase YrdN [Philodulcilactobacillus myokoensis]